MVLRLAISLLLGRYHQYQHDISGVDRVIQARAEPKLIPPLSVQVEMECTQAFNSASLLL
jgi:hypothetical protein